MKVDLTFLNFIDASGSHNLDYTTSNDQPKSNLNRFDLAYMAQDSLIKNGTIQLFNDVTGSRFFIQHENDNRFTLVTGKGWSNIDFKTVGMILLNHFTMVEQLNNITFESEYIDV